jgi:hypothetical protein
MQLTFWGLGSTQVQERSHYHKHLLEAIVDLQGLCLRAHTPGGLSHGVPLYSLSRLAVVSARCSETQSPFFTFIPGLGHSNLSISSASPVPGTVLSAHHEPLEGRNCIPALSTVVGTWQLLNSLLNVCQAKLIIVEDYIVITWAICYWEGKIQEVQAWREKSKMANWMSTTRILTLWPCKLWTLQSYD